MLFGESKDKTKTPGFLEKFDQDKKSAKERFHSQVLANEFQQLQETLNRIQLSLSGTDANISNGKVAQDKISNLSLTVQSSLNSLQVDVSHRFEVLLDKLNTQQQAMGEFDMKIQKSKDVTIGLAQTIESLKGTIESLKQDHMQDVKKLEEASKLLSPVASECLAKPAKVVMVDTAVQKSPVMDKGLVISPHILPSNNHKQNDPQGRRASIPQMRSLKAIRKRKSRPLVLWNRKQHCVSDENNPSVVSKPLMKSTLQSDQNHFNKAGTTHGLPGSKPTGCFMTPLSCWSSDSDHYVSIPVRLPDQVQTVSQLRSESLCNLFDSDSEVWF
ncbi:interactor of HORMAD1 protein 1 [Synchiropus picturatus]